MSEAPRLLAAICDGAGARARAQAARDAQLRVLPCHRSLQTNVLVPPRGRRADFGRCCEGPIGCELSVNWLLLRRAAAVIKPGVNGACGCHRGLVDCAVQWDGAVGGGDRTGAVDAPLCGPRRRSVRQGAGLLHHRSVLQ